MTTNLLLLFVSSVFCAIVISLQYTNLHIMVQLFSRKIVTSNSSFITSTVQSKSNVSSVWCHTIEEKRFCTFENLYYVPFEKQFIFLLSNNSVLSGVTNKNDLKSIDLSSIANHNGFAMKLAILTPDNKIFRRNRIKIKHGFIFWRFKWDNIMHVIHDDLLPLYVTFTSICTGNIDQCVSKYQIAFADEGEYGPLSEWYNIFSVSEPILLHKSDVNNIICFEEGRAGLITESVWFQYGFGIPQGPVTETKFTGNQMRQFSEFILQKFNIPIIEDLKESTNIAFFSRKTTRRIINEETVVKVIKNVHNVNFPTGPKLKIFNFDLTTNDTRCILSHLLQSKIVIGMHGSAMVLNIFLKPGSVIIELFPFGINPNYVSPVKAMCDLQDVGLMYHSWINSKEENTVTHPEAPPLLGGINHLSTNEQEQIVGTTEIPAVKCCHDPAYLYRMFQDTIVGSDFAAVLNHSFLQQKTFSAEAFSENGESQVLEHWYFPAPVTSILCSYVDRTVNITWTPPINTLNPQYHVTVVATSALQFSSTTRKPEFELLLPHSVHGEIIIHIWIKCINQGEESLDSYKQCKIHV